MEWTEPRWLYLTLPLLVAWLILCLYSRSRRQHAARAFVSSAMLPRILPLESSLRFWTKLILQEMALLASLLALAGPRYGLLEEKVIPRGSDLYVLIDVSRSMLAEDVSPSRLGRAKADVSALVNRLEGERIGLIAFAGQAVVKCPLTIDYDSFRRSLAELDPNSAPRGGTAIGDAIRKALEVFDAQSGRDQAILLISDGDDQQSYPLEAAAIAAERQVTVFAVGLGDASQGARIPRDAAAGTFMEHEGQQVWSKLDGSLLEQIALKTSGIYIPVGTRAYDLGELYADHLKGRQGADLEGKTRIRRAEQFQLPLALALIALIANWCVSRFVSGSQSLSPDAQASSITQPAGGKPQVERGQTNSPRASVVSPAVGLLLLITLLFGQTATDARAEEPEPPIPAQQAFKQGMESYRAGDYEAAFQAFSKARLALAETDRSAAAIADFNQGCSAHRNGDRSRARESYLSAGLSRDKRLAAKAHFNLGTMVAEEAREIVGTDPVAVPKEKREEVVNKLREAVAAFRHVLELDPTSTAARRDIELIRTWIKYYSERWAEADRQKRRQESNLLQFLEFVMETQRGLKQATESMSPKASRDAYAELKRLQSELQQEVGPLREKINSDLRPPAEDDPSQSAGTGQQPAGPHGSGAAQPDPEQLEQAIRLLTSWVDAADSKMGVASGHLGRRQKADAVAAQSQAIEELEKIWEAVIPFQPLLAKTLAEQTAVTRALGVATRSKPARPTDPEAEQRNAEGAAIEVSDGSDSEGGQGASTGEDSEGEEQRANGTNEPGKDTNSLSTGSIESANALTPERLKELHDQQAKALRWTTLLQHKAASELEQLPADAATVSDDLSGDDTTLPQKTKPSEGDSDPGNSQDDNTDGNANPEAEAAAQLVAMRAALTKAKERLPEAVEAESLSGDLLGTGNAGEAHPAAERARAILKEIQDALPRQKQPPNQQQQDQSQKNQQNSQQNQSGDQQDKQQDQKDQDDSSDESQSNKEKSNDDQEQQEDKDQSKEDQQEKKDDKGSQSEDDASGKEEKPQPTVSKDRIEEALRKVRERQDAKRERDRKLKARLLGRPPVEKDW